jgi:iron complex outermembrane receptor protein
MSNLLLAAALAVAPDAASQPTTVDSVIVTASPDPEDPPVVAHARRQLSETPGAVAVVSAESYRDRFAPGISDLLRDVPGVYAQKKWGGDTRLSIRGSGIGNSSHNRGTLLAQDGVPFNEADGFGDFQLINPLIARYTEVYKGGNALRFGGALLGGAINLVTPTGRTAGSPLTLRLDGGSYGTLRAHAEAAGAWGPVDGFVAATALKADGWRAQSEQQSQHLSANLGYAFGEDREVRLVLSGGSVHQEIPGSLTLRQALENPEAANAGNLTNNYQRDMWSARATLQTRWRFGPQTVLEGALFATWKDLDHPIFQVIDQESRNFGGFARVDWTGEVLDRRADAFYGLYVRKGDLDATQWENLRGSRGRKTAQSRQNATGLDVFAEGRLFVLPEVALVAGGSYGRAERDYVATRVPAGPASFDLTRSVTYEWFAPRVGLLWESQGGAQVYANLTRSVEPPNFSALSPTAAGFTALEPQEAWTGEIGARGRSGAFTWDVALYRAELDNELLNYTVNPAQGVPASTFNADRTVHQGVEAALDWRFARGWRLRQTYAWSDFRFVDDVQYGDARLPVVPEHLYRAELRYDHPSGWFVAPSLEWSPKEATVDYANTLEAPSYAVVSVGAGWRGDRLTLFADLRNVADERYVSNFSALTDARTASTAVFFPGEGRSLFVGIRKDF